MLIVIGGLLVICLITVIGWMVSAARTEGRNGVVQSVQWTTSLPILALQPARYQNWFDEIPSDATLGNCTQRVFTIQDEPAANANKVCGTPYTVDKGSGYAEVVQDCQYEIMKDYCEFTVMEWAVIDTARLQGADLSPVAPQPVLQQGQRVGEPQTQYAVVFQTDEGAYTYTTTDFDIYRQFVIGSTWVLNINAFNQVVSVDPAQ